MFGRVYMYVCSLIHTSMYMHGPVLSKGTTTTTTNGLHLLHKVSNQTLYVELDVCVRVYVCV